jgi:transcription elongation factor Elf1
MVQTWKTRPGEDFTCPHCKAVYAVTITRYPTRDSDKATCQVCGEVMTTWNDTAVPNFTLKERPKNA